MSTCPDDGLEEREPGAGPETPEETPETPDLTPDEPREGGRQVVGRSRIQDLICEMGSLHPQILNGLFMNLLADHFSQASSIMIEALKDYRWRPEDSDINIMTSSQFMGADRANEPMTIVVKRGAQNYTPIGIGGKGEVEVDGEVIYHMVEGTHTFIATGGSGAETELLGEELAMIWEFESYRMSHEFAFTMFQPGSVGVLGIIEELGNVVGVPVTIKYAYQSITKVSPTQPTHKVLDVGQSIET